MIIDTLANMELYQDFNEKIYKGLAFLKETDVTALPIGRYDIDGDAIFALVQEYETKPLDQCRWEAHYKYTDIQYVVMGEEKMGYTNITGTSKTEDRPAEDVYFLEADGDQFLVKAGFFAIFTPQDAHMPGIAIAEPKHIKKVVIKIAL